MSVGFLEYTLEIARISTSIMGEEGDISCAFTASMQMRNARKHLCVTGQQFVSSDFF